jgi:hypothetical protein
MTRLRGPSANRRRFLRFAIQDRILALAVVAPLPPGRAVTRRRTHRAMPVIDSASDLASVFKTI